MQLLKHACVEVLDEQKAFGQLVDLMNKWTKGSSKKQADTMKMAATTWVDVIRKKLHFVAVEATSLQMALTIFQVGLYPFIYVTHMLLA